VCLGHSVHASVTLADPRLAPTHPTRPYHSVLILNANLPSDATPALRRATELLDRSGPSKSLGEAADELGMAFGEMATMVDHLCRWGRARLVYVISERSLFFVTPNVDVSEHAAAFSARFPRLDLARVLAGVCEPKPGLMRPRRLSEHNELGSDAVPVFTYLLRRGLVTQVKQFVYFAPPVAEAKPSLMTSPRGNAPLDMPEGLSKRQADYLRAMWDPDDALFKLLLRACLLFGGTNHVAEICFRLNVNRKAIDALCSRFSEALVVALHEV